MNNDKLYILIEDYKKLRPLSTYGLFLARQMDLPVVLLGVDEVPFPMGPASFGNRGNAHPDAELVKELKEKAAPHFEERLKEARDIYPHVDYNLRIGDKQRRAKSVADEKDPYIMVIQGKSEAATLNDWFGTVETSIARDSDCPVLVVPQDFMFKPIEKVMFLMDLDEMKEEEIIKDTRLLNQLGASVQVVFISEEKIDEDDERFTQTVKFFQRELGEERVAFFGVYGNEKAERIEELSKMKDADWLAFDFESKNFFDRMFGNINTNKLILKADIPVLVFS